MTPRSALPLQTARTVLQVPLTKSSSQFIRNAYESFVWDDHGEEISQWNAFAGKAAGGEDVEVREEGDELPHLSYKGRTLVAPVEHERGDNTIMVHTLAQLVKEDSELRLFVETSCNSEYAFLPLPPGVWAQLESEFGREAVAFRFLPIPGDLDDFYEAVNAAASERRDYPDDPKPEPDLEGIAFSKLCRNIEAALRPSHASLQANYVSFPINQTAYLKLVTATDAERDRLRRDVNGLRHVKVLADPVCNNFKRHLIGVTFPSKEAMKRDHGSEWLDDTTAFPLEVPDAWKTSAQVQAQRTGPAAATGKAMAPGTRSILCPHCGSLVQAVPKIDSSQFRVMSCIACRKTILLGLAPVARGFFWIMFLAAIALWIFSPDTEPGNIVVAVGVLIAADAYLLQRERKLSRLAQH